MINRLFMHSQCLELVIWKSIFELRNNFIILKNLHIIFRYQCTKSSLKEICSTIFICRSRIYNNALLTALMICLKTLTNKMLPKTNIWHCKLQKHTVAKLKKYFWQLISCCIKQKLSHSYMVNIGQKDKKTVLTFIFYTICLNWARFVIPLYLLLIK